MARRLTTAGIAAILAALAWFAFAGEARAQYYSYGSPGWVSPEPNYYSMPAGQEGLTAALYPSPRPTPPLIGQTYITYQALAPQEFMYLHRQVYETANDCGQVTQTRVWYGHHISLHPSLTVGAPGLHTPSHVCRF